MKTFGCRKTVDRIGILIGQLGTPTSPTKQAVKPYLKQFLSDPRVIEKNRLLWWIILNLFILPSRPAKSAALYARIWREDGSPLLKLTESLSTTLQERFNALGADVTVGFGMRYGEPSLEDSLDRLIDEFDCKRILLFNMYPQYSATTSASNYDAVFQHILRRRFIPTLRVAEPYYRDQRYIQALAAVINESVAGLATAPERLVLSYHGIPDSYRQAGDPYCCMCTETTKMLKSLVDFDANNIIHTYQSRFGKGPWLTPYTDETIKDLAQAGVKHIAVAAPGFTTDCLETLDELGNELKEQFEELGGERLFLVPCLNDHPLWIDAIAAIMEDEMSSWLASDRQTVDSECVICPVRP